MTPSYWQNATNYLTDTDEIMAGLIVSYPDEVLKNHNNAFHFIMGVSVKLKLLHSPNNGNLIGQWRHGICGAALTP